MNKIVPALQNSRSYAVLRERVKKTLLEGQQKIEAEKVKTYWRTGHLINEYLGGQNLAKDHAAYGKDVIERLAKDLKFNERILYQCLRFAQVFSNLYTCTSLTWSHFRLLIAVDDPKLRQDLTEQADKKNWTVEELEEKIRALNPHPLPGPDGPAHLEPPALGPLYTFQIVKRANIHSKKPELLLDLGFSQRFGKKFFGPGAVSWKEGQIVTWADQIKIKPAPNTAADLYTYKAYVERVIDGDTLKLEVQPGFWYCFTDRFRLRGIDCPELGTPEGEAAKKFVESELSRVDYVVIKSTPSGAREKWGRYVVDVFYGANNQHYLNQILLDKGYATILKE